jgi:hypothetical protein
MYLNNTEKMSKEPEIIVSCSTLVTALMKQQNISELVTVYG